MDELAQHEVTCTQASGSDVDHPVDQTTVEEQHLQQQQHELLLSFCPTPEAHSQPHQPESGGPPCDPPAEQLESVSMTDAAPALGDERPRPDQGQGRAAAEKQEVVVTSPQHAEALPAAAAASAAQVGREGSARLSDVPTQQTGKQHDSSVPTMLADKQRAGSQPEAAGHQQREVVNSVSTACDRMRPAEAVSVHQEADATAPSANQQELPSAQCAIHAPAQEACTDAQQLADDTAHSCAAGHSQHEMTCDKVFQGISNTISAAEAVYPLRDEGSDPQQLASSPMAHDTPVAEDAPVANGRQTAHNASGTDVIPTANDAVMADVTLLADDTPMADDTPPADVTSKADETAAADVISLAHSIPMTDNTYTVGPAAGSSKVVPASLQEHKEGITALLRAGLSEQQAHVPPCQQPNGTAHVEQGVGSNQLGQQAGLLPSSTSVIVSCHSRQPRTLLSACE